MEKIQLEHSGTDVIIFKMFSPKNGVFVPNTASFAKTGLEAILSVVAGFQEKRQFFAENVRKALKLLIITLTPGGKCRGFVNKYQ
jgi:hypothetical protein